MSLNPSFTKTHLFPIVSIAWMTPWLLLGCPQENCETSTFYPDGDGDGYGNGSLSVEACEAPTGFVSDDTDCDDGDPSIWPESTDRSGCDGLDNDCDGEVDETDEDGGLLTFYADSDGDGYGSADETVLACILPEGYVDNAEDCDDTDASVHPGSIDAPDDGIDQDCDDGDATYPDCDELVFHSGSVTFTGANAADEMADFCWQYNAVAGDLVIEAVTGIELSVLGCLCEVAGGLTVRNNPALTVVSLESCTEINGDLAVTDNESLVELTADGPGIGGDVTVARNPSLTELSIDVDQLGGGVDIEDNDSLENLGGINRYETIRSLLVVGNDAMTVLYLDNIEEVQGDVNISSNAVLDRLWGDYGGLGIRVIGGDFVVRDNPELEYLDDDDDPPEHQLEEVGGDWIVAENPSLMEIYGPVPAFIGGDLILSNNERLNQLGWSCSPEVGGDVVVIDLPAMWDATAGAYCEEDPVSIGGDVVVVGVGDADTDHFNLLRDISSVGGDVLISGNMASVSMDAVTLGGSLRVTGNRSRDEAFSAPLQTLPGDLLIAGNSSEEPVWLNDLETITGNVAIEGNATIADLGFLSSLRQISRLEIYDNPSLLDLSGTSLEEVASLFINDNSALTSLQGLEGVTEIPGQVNIFDNPHLDSFAGLDNVETIGGRMYVFDGPDDFEGLGALETLFGLFVVDVTDECSFTSFEGLDSLTEIGSGALYIVRCESMETMDGLEGLTHIYAGLRMQENMALTDVAALHGLELLVSDLVITGNPELSNADAEALAAAIDTIYGSTTISNNGP